MGNSLYHVLSTINMKKKTMFIFAYVHIRGLIKRSIVTPVTMLNTVIIYNLLIIFHNYLWYFHFEHDKNDKK